MVHMEVCKSPFQTRHISLVNLPKSRHGQIVDQHLFLILKWLASLNGLVGQFPQLDGLVIGTKHQ